MESNLGLIVQLNGVFLVTIVSLFLRRSLKLTALKYWTVAWLCLSFGLICLQLGFRYTDLNNLLFTYYFLGNYIFGFLLAAGCRSLDGKYELRSRVELLIVPFVIFSIALPHLANDLSDVYFIHAFLMSLLYGASFISLRMSLTKGFGWSVLHITLAMLAFEGVLYFVLHLTTTLFVASSGLLVYAAVVDLVLQTALGFGMVIVLLEGVLSEFRTENEGLKEAHNQLLITANTDPLTAAFNRHAFYGFVNKNGDNASPVSGCVGFFDIDDLKGINDCYGHLAGDAVIRWVAGSIRNIVRAEDLIYRWGGDEFFVIMVSMDSEMAEMRMSRLETTLRSVKLDHIPEPVDIGVSWGFTDFSNMDDLEQAIASADAAMYERKHLRKLSMPGHIPPGNAEAQTIPVGY